MFLLYGSREVISFSSKKTFPESGFKSPAIIFRVVVLPHPEGPKRVMNFPFSMFILKSSKIISLSRDIEIFFNFIIYLQFSISTISNIKYSNII